MKLKTDERQKQLIDEAISIINKYGVANFSIRHLAKNSNISEGAIYKHFKSKEEIISGIFQRLKETEPDLMDMVNSKSNPLKKLKKFIKFHIHLFQLNPELVSIMFSEEIFAASHATYNNFIDLVKVRHILMKNIIDEGLKQKIFIKVDSDDLATMIQGYLRLTMMKWKNSGYKFSLEEKGEKFLNTLEILLLKGKAG